MISIALPRHLEAINRIYNDAVADGLRTAHTSPVSLKQRQEWFEKHDTEHFPVFVYLDGNSVTGWLSVSPYRKNRQALDDVVEVSYYVDYNHHGKGVASALMEHAINFCQSTGYRIIVAILVDGNTPSIRLLEKFSFNEGGRIPDAISYEGELRDHLYMFKNLSAKSW